MRRLVRERLVQPTHFDLNDRVLCQIPQEDGSNRIIEGWVSGHTAKECHVQFIRLQGIGYSTFQLTIPAARLERPSMYLTLNGKPVPTKLWPESRVLAVGDTLFVHDGLLRRSA